MMSFYETLGLIAIVLVIYTYFIRGVPPRPESDKAAATSTITAADVAGNAVDFGASIAHGGIKLASDAASVLTGAATTAATSAVQVVSDVTTATTAGAKDAAAAVTAAPAEHYGNIDRGDNPNYGAPQGSGPAWSRKQLVGFEKADGATFSATLGRLHAMQDAGSRGK